jgi:hypothetical protein
LCELEDLCLFRCCGTVGLERQAEQMSRILVVIDVVFKEHLKRKGKVN